MTEHRETGAGDRRDERLEACLRLATQMHALSGLYQGVVHDLKSPLNALVVNLELLRSTLDPEDPVAEKQQRYARVLHEELMRLNRSIETLLPAAAPAGDEPGRLDLAKLADEVAAFVAPQARQQRVAVTRPEVTALPMPVDGIRSRLKQAFLAVAVNALEAMPDGGALTVETVVRDGRGQVIFADTGPGVPAVIRDRMFELYTSTKEGHHGIGLYVADQVVKSTKGSLHVSSGADHGARFAFHIPLAA